VRSMTNAATTLAARPAATANGARERWKSTPTWSPTGDEVAWASSRARSDQHLLALVLALRCFQGLGYFPKPVDVPVMVVEHVRRGLELPEGTSAFIGLRRGSGSGGWCASALAWYMIRSGRGLSLRLRSVRRRRRGPPIPPDESVAPVPTPIARSARNLPHQPRSERSRRPAECSPANLSPADRWIRAKAPRACGTGPSTRDPSRSC
jgi:hypothetical protein